MLLVLVMDMPSLLQRLQADNTSGATTLVHLALDILSAFATQKSEPDFHPALLRLLRHIMAAQPSMAVMINLAQHVLQACPETVPIQTAPGQLQQVLSDFRQHLQHSTAAICQHALSTLPPQTTVLTYSNSATVTAALQYAHDHGRLQRVILSESRPAYDGRPQALALLQRGLNVAYSVDMGLFEYLPAVQAVWVGADAVFPHGVLNKLGTHALAQLARRYGVPIFSLCAAHKYLPATAVPLLRIKEHPGQEVWPEAPTALSISNHYFDTTPLALFNGIISEHGILSATTLAANLQQQPLAPALQQWLDPGSAAPATPS